MKTRRISRVAMHKKKKKKKKPTSESSKNEGGFLMPCNEWTKILQALSMVWRFYLKQTEIFYLLTDTF